MKHIVLYSGGVNSAVTALLIAYQHPRDTILLHTPTYAEHPDADRFRQAVADYLRLPVTTVKDGRDLWTLIIDEHCLPSHFIPFCTRILKQEPLDNYLSSFGGDFTLYFGYDVNEWRRIQKQWARFQVKGYKSKYPLADLGWASCDAKKIIVDSGFCIPETYEHLGHNNCLPCFKGGKGHFWSVWKFYPYYFARAVEAEQNIGHTVFKEAALSELAKLWAKGERPKSASMDGVPCMCAL